MIDILIKLENDYIVTKGQYNQLSEDKSCEVCNNINCGGVCKFQKANILKEYSTLTSIYLMGRKTDKHICHNCSDKLELELCEYCGWYFCKSCMYEEDRCKICYEIMK